MKSERLRQSSNKVKSEPGLSDTAPVPRNVENDPFSNFKKSIKGTNMLTEISQPKLGVAELRNLGRSLDITEINASDIREQILRKAFDSKWTLTRVKNKAASMTSQEEFRMRKDSHNDKIITKQALEIKELKKKQKETDKSMKVIQKKVAKQDAEVEKNAEQIENVSSELGDLSSRVDYVEVKAEKNSDSVNMLVEKIGNNSDSIGKNSDNIGVLVKTQGVLVEQIGKNSANMYQGFTQLSNIVKESFSQKNAQPKETTTTSRSSTTQNDTDNTRIKAYKNLTKRSKYSDTNSTSIHRNHTPERRLRSEKAKDSANRKSVRNRREESEDDKESRGRSGRSGQHERCSPRTRSPRTRSQRTRSPRTRSPRTRSPKTRSAVGDSPPVQPKRSQSARSRSPCRSTRNMSSKISSPSKLLQPGTVSVSKTIKTSTHQDLNFNYDVASRKEGSQVHGKRSFSNSQSLPNLPKPSWVQKSHEEVFVKKRILITTRKTKLLEDARERSVCYSDYPYTDELDNSETLLKHFNSQAHSPENQVWHEEENEC